MSNLYKGYGIQFGTDGVTASTLTGLGTLSLLQSGEYNAEADEEIILDNTGNTATVVKRDHKSKATLEFIPTLGTNAATLTIGSWPSAGVTLALTDSAFTPFADTWIVDNLQLSRSNTKALMARISLSAYLSNNIP
jgi:hypothetical protein